MGAAGLFAVLASACCIGPVVLTVLGISALGASTAFESLRPLFLGLTALLLGAALYFAYFRAPACAVPGQLRRFNRGFLWLAAVAVVGVALFPVFAGTLLGGSTLPVNSPSMVALHIDGMTCPACVGGIKTALEGVPGVIAATVNYEDARALVAVASPFRSAEALVRTVEEAGYKARLVRSGADSQEKENRQMESSRDAFGYPLARAVARVHQARPFAA